MAFEVGEVYAYHYLWHREYRRGEETGRKSRPAAVVVVTETSVFLFPITSRHPGRRASVAVPAIERRRAGLAADAPSYVIIDEFNVCPRDARYDFAASHPIGRFSKPFMRELARSIRRVLQEHRATPVRRS